MSLVVEFLGEEADLSSPTGCRGRAGAAPRVLLNSMGAGTAESRRPAEAERGPREEEAAGGARGLCPEAWQMSELSQHTPGREAER